MTQESLDACCEGATDQCQSRANLWKQALPSIDEAEPSAPIATLTMPHAQHSKKRMHSNQLGTAFLMTVVSGSGGAGKSTVSFVAAHLAHERGFKTLLLDLDTQFGDVGFMMNVSQPLSIDDVLEDPSLLSKCAQQNEADITCVTAPSNLEQSELFDPVVLDLIKPASAEFDVIVVNTGARWTEIHAQLIEQSARTLFIVDQRASSVRACQHALEMCTRCGIATSSFVFLLNRCKKGSLFTSIDVSCALQGSHVVEIRDGGSEVEELLGAGLVQELIDSRNELCHSMRNLMRDLLPEHANTEADARIGFRSLRGRRPLKTAPRDLRGNFTGSDAYGNGISAPFDQGSSRRRLSRKVSFKTSLKHSYDGGSLDRHGREVYR